MRRLIIAILLFTYGQFVFAAVSIEIDPATVKLDDTLRITLTFDSMQAHGVPDLTPLEQDFLMLGTEHHVSYTVINGQARSINQWSFIVKPKKAGTIVIPSIQIGQEKSLPSQVRVIEPVPDRQNNSDAEDVAEQSVLTAHVDNEKPYINQQVIYTVKFFNNQRLYNVQYTPPHVDDALIVPLSDGRHYQTQSKGQTYEVDEQQYAIFPQKKGPLQISPPLLNAVADAYSPRPLRIQAKPVNLTVNPLPPDFSNQTWLPSSKVVLKEEYDHPETTLAEGSTLIRTITLQASGLVAQLLPTLTFAQGNDFSVYPEKPTIDNAMQQGELLSSSSVKVTYLLTKPGIMKLPAVHVPWFNTLTGKRETASLPEHELIVKPKPGIGKPKLPAPLPRIKVTPPVIAYDYSFIWRVCAGFILLGLVWVIWYFFKLKQSKLKNNTLPASLNAIRQACKRNEPKQARTALLAWANKQWPGINLFNLNELRDYIDDDELKKQLDQLSCCLYSHDKMKWSGNELWRCISNLKLRTQKSTRRKRSLPPMNP